MILACRHLSEAARLLRTGVVEPNDRRHKLATMAGVAGDSRLRDVLRPVGIDVPYHLQHAPCHDLGVKRILREVGEVMACCAALIRRDPCRQVDHQTRELAGVHIAQHLHILVDGADHRPDVSGIRERVRDLVCLERGLHAPRIVDVIHRRSAHAVLNGPDRRPLGLRQDNGDRGGKPEKGREPHWPKPGAGFYPHVRAPEQGVSRPRRQRSIGERSQADRASSPRSTFITAPHGPAHTLAAVRRHEGADRRGLDVARRRSATALSSAGR